MKLPFVNYKWTHSAQQDQTARMRLYIWIYIDVMFVFRIALLMSIQFNIVDLSGLRAIPSLAELIVTTAFK